MNAQAPSPTPTIQASLHRVRSGLRVGFQANPADVRPAPKKPSRIARDLALGHRILAAIVNEEVGGPSAIARKMGLHPARVSVLISLAFLAPDLQLELLEARPGDPATTLHLRDWVAISRNLSWGQQRVCRASFQLKG